MKIPTLEFHEPDGHEWQPHGCILCGRKPCLTGVLVPSSQELRSAIVTVSRGKGWRMVYGLCSRHKPGQETAQRVEDYILNRARVLRMALGGLA
jgi:hypothetical protein